MTDNICCRNRDCQLLFKPEQGSVCPVCGDFFSDLAVKVDEGVDLKEEDTDNVSEHESDIIESLEARSDFDFDFEKVEPTVIPILKRKISPHPQNNGKRKRKKKVIPDYSEVTNSDSESDQLYNGGDKNQEDSDWKPTDQNGAEEEEMKGEKIVKPREKLPCPFCEDECLRTSKMLATHLKYSHPKEKDSELYQQTIADNIQAGFVCSICGMKFGTDQWLDKHMADIHNFNINKFPCGVCGKLLKSESTLHSHMLYIHKKSKEQMCGVCGKIFRNKFSLKEHTDSQHSNLEFPCAECGQIFNCKKGMQKHFNKKHVIKERQHKCQKCEKAFHLPGDLRKHISQVHDKLKPFYCEFCQFRTATISNLNIHRKKSHERPSISKKALVELVETGQHPYYTLSDIPMIRIGPY